MTGSVIARAKNVRMLIVEMWWGKPHELHVQDVDKRTGELYTCAVVPNGPPDPERREFACSATNWKAAIELGQRFGWEPRGALFRRWWHDDPEPARDFSYEPDGWLRGIHEVEDGDARGWSAALERCADAADDGKFGLPSSRSPTLLVEGMTANEYRQANRGLTVQFLRSFALFLGRGRFRFGWDS